MTAAQAAALVILNPRGLAWGAMGLDAALDRFH